MSVCALVRPCGEHVNAIRKTTLKHKSVRVTFQRNPVVFPLALRCRFHLLVFLMNQEVLHSQSSCFPDCAFCTANQSVWWICTTECAATPLIAHSRAHLLRAVPTLMCLMREWLKGKEIKNTNLLYTHIYILKKYIIDTHIKLTQAWLSSSLRKFSYTPPLPPSPPLPSSPPALLLPLSLPLKTLLSVAEYTEKEADMALQRRDTSSPSPSISVVTPSMPLSPYSLPSPKTPEMSCQTEIQGVNRSTNIQYY